MARLKGTILASPVVPTDSLDTYPTHSAEYGKGGHKSVNNISDLYLISLSRRERNIRKTTISKIRMIESTGDVNYIAPTTSANKTFAATDLTVAIE